MWIDKISNIIESPQFKKKPLRDQHGLCEKYLAEINGQKTKITLSIEKLQVIFVSHLRKSNVSLNSYNIRIV